jgi:glutamate formiminotransferase/formiminotetrahydrofolate cyclodeaminase
MKQLIECVPNISEGSDIDKINAIANIVETISGVKLLNVDPGKATNRTVITFVGEPKNVIEAAFLLIQKSQELIDMSKHKGEHPRMGATDVCPLVPISNISMDEVAKWAHILAKKVGENLNIPVYCYENAALKKERTNLANCRSGEYEGLKKKLIDKNWKPDYGPSEFNSSIAKSGATAISARDFLVAYNINLNTTSTRKANSVAFDIREAGRIKREGDKINGKIITDNKGNPMRTPGFFKSVKGIGWYIKEYGIAQISYNLTDINLSPLHKVFDKTCEMATNRGLRVTGSELIGLVPKKVLIDAGKYFLQKQKRSKGIAEKEIIKIAIKSLGLDELSSFNPNERIIEYMIENKKESNLIDMSLKDFANETSSESPAPGGGSIAAYCGTIGASLATMVANLSANKRGWDNRWEEFSDYAEKGLDFQDQLLNLVDEDTIAFNKIMEAFQLPKDNKADTEKREIAIQEATKNAIETPFKVMEIALASMDIVKKMAEIGNPNSITDACVAALCLRTAVRGAFLNVKINCLDYKDKKFVKKIIEAGENIEIKAKNIEEDIIKITEKVMNS